MRPAVPAVFDNVIARVAHHNHVGHSVADARQLTGYGGAKFRNNFGSGTALALQRQSQLAHDIGALECDFAGNRFGHLCFESISDVGGQAGLQRFRQRLQRSRARNVVV